MAGSGGGGGGVPSADDGAIVAAAAAVAAATVAAATAAAAAAAEEVGGSSGDDNAVKGRRVGTGIGDVNTGGEVFANNNHVNVLRFEAGCQSRRFLEKVVVLDRREHADSQPVQLEQGFAEDGDGRGDIVVVEGWVGRGRFHANRSAHARRDLMADTVQLDEDVPLDDLAGQHAGLEAHGVDDKLLLNRQQRVKEQTRLRPHVAESGRQGSLQGPTGSAFGSGKESIPDRLVGLHGGSIVQGVGGVSRSVQGDVHLG